MKTITWQATSIRVEDKPNPTLLEDGTYLVPLKTRFGEDATYAFGSYILNEVDVEQIYFDPEEEAWVKNNLENFQKVQVNMDDEYVFPAWKMSADDFTKYSLRW